MSSIKEKTGVDPQQAAKDVKGKINKAIDSFDKGDSDKSTQQKSTGSDLKEKAK